MKNPSILISLETAPKRLIQPTKILRSIIDVICAIDENGILVYASPSAPSLFGYTAEEMIGHSFTDYILPEDTEFCLKSIARGLNGIQGSNWENRFIHKNGTVIPIIWSGRWDVEDSLFYCVARNGTEKQAVENRLQKACQLAKIGHFEYDFSSSQYLYISDNFLEIYGLNKEVHQKFSFEMLWELVHPDDLEMVKLKVLDQSPDKNHSIDYRIIRPNGELAFVNRVVDKVTDEKGKVIKVVGTIQDITDRKLTELALQQSESRLRSMVEHGHDIIGIVDAQGNYLFVSDNVETQLGYRKEDLLGKNAFDFIHPEDIHATAAVLEAANQKEVIAAPHFRFRNGHGQWRWIELTLSNQVKNPAVNGYITQSRDITDKKEKEEELLLSEQKFKSLVQHSADLVVIIDDKFNFTYVSENICSILDYTPEELLGQFALDYLVEEDRIKVAGEIFRVLDGTTEGKGVEHRFIHKNGDVYWFESRGTNLHGHNSIKGIMVNTRNITERVKLQEKLNQEQLNKQKEITAAVIKAQETERSQLGLELHDNVNQVLTTVKLYNEMYLTGVVQDKSLLEKSTLYTQDCINEIRSISKRLSAPTLGNITLTDSISELVESINITRRLVIEYDAETIDNTRVSEDLHLAIYRIVQEGLNNVLKYSKAKTAWVGLEQEGSEIKLLITDNGVGFDTTHKRGGIGITNMKTRAENVNASFLLVSAPGEGCEISILFPLNGTTD